MFGRLPHLGTSASLLIKGAIPDDFFRGDSELVSVENLAGKNDVPPRGKRT